MLPAELLPTVTSMGKVFLDTIKIWQTLKGKPAKQVIRNQTNNNTVNSFKFRLILFVT